MTTLVLVRHAQSAPSPELPEDAWPLTDKGRGQARDLIPLLRELGVEVLASSPYLRTVETLAPFAEAADLEIAVDHDLRERSFGAWIPDIEEVNEAIRRMHADPDYSLEGGESARSCMVRFEAVLARLTATHPGRVIAIGSHGGLLSHFLARHVDGLPPEAWFSIRNPHVFIFDAGAELRWRGERTLAGVPGLWQPKS